MREHRHRSPASGGKALLLMIKGHSKQPKRFGFGRRLDPSIHLAMIRRMFDLLTRFPGTDIVIVQSGDLPPLAGARYLPERGSDFNQRFVNALDDTFALGYRRVVAVGADIPTLCRNDIETALAHDGLVLGPTFDGGFYLAGLGPEEVRLFERLPWRRRTLLAHLQERMTAADRRCLWLARRRDIDDAASGRAAASLLMGLLRRWLKEVRPDDWPPAFLLGLPDRPLPDPRYCSLPPPAL